MVCPLWVTGCSFPQVLNRPRPPCRLFCRDGRLSRERLPGDAAVEQVVAANVDTVFLVEPCLLNPRRLERTLVAAWSSGARPVIILSKSDLVADDVQRHKAERIGHGVPVLVISLLLDSGLDAVLEYCQRGPDYCAHRKLGSGQVYTGQSARWIGGRSHRGGPKA